MPLTARQRNKLPKSAFVYNKGPRSKWRYPVPTKAQARKAGISEKQRLNIHRNALSRGAQKGTSGSYKHIAKHVKARGSVKSVRSKPTRRRTTRRRTRRR